MILRIEDTDQTRYVPGAEEYIINTLEWAGIELDEGPKEGGEFVPYRQSERKDIYQQYAQQLISNGHAYYAFDSAEELEAMRTRLREEKAFSQHYNAESRQQMKNSFTLSEEEVKSRIESGQPYVVRLNVPAEGQVAFTDIIRGDVSVDCNTLDDKVLLKSDGLPTYHLANVVDDHLMQITHVIRGEEWLPSLPIHVLLYRYFDWQAEMPSFAHLPLILKPEGNGKLSKRDADKSGFPIFPLSWEDVETKEVSEGFKEAGYLPEALLNFLAFLGWNPGDDRELFNKEELIAAFSLDRIGKGGAKFDIAKAQWYNQHYIKHVPNQDLEQILANALSEEGITFDDNKVAEVVGLMKERITFQHELVNQARFFFVNPEVYDERAVQKKWNEQAVSALEAVRDAYLEMTTFDQESIKVRTNEICTELDIPLGKIMPALRIAITGSLSGPDLMSTLQILGANEVSERIVKAISTIGN